MSVFTVEIAGVPAEIKCTFPENMRFFEGYFTDREPLISVQAAADDLQAAQQELDIADDAAGMPRFRRPDGVLENIAIHGILSEKLLEHGVLLVHGSALCMDGQAVVFLAHSGIGKSTHSRLWRETFGSRVWMINDDKPMLRILDGKAYAYGSPWNGRHHLSRNASAPLKAIVLLSRDEENHIMPVQKADAFPLLMPYALSSKNPATMKRILEVEKLLLNAADFYLLGCNMTPEAARVAHQGIFKPVQE